MLKTTYLKLFSISLILFCSLQTALGQMRTPDQEPFIPGNIIVQTAENVDLEKLLRTLPAQYEFKVDQLLASHMRAWLVEFNPYSIAQMDALNMVNRLDGITLVQNNHVIEMRSTVPDDPQFGQQWHHLNTGQTGGTVDADTDIDEAWDITTGGQNALGHDIVVCILEGVDFSHNDLVQNRWTNPNEIPGNGIDDDGNGYVDDIYGWNVGNNTGNLTGGGHGTNVAGMIGARGDNTLGVVGANWNVKMMNVMGYNMSEASVVSAYNYPLSLRKLYNESNGTEGAFVVSTNASWGIDNANPDNYPIWCQFYDTLGKYGIVNCGATTNSNLNVDVSGDMPTACPSDYMIGVGRSDHNDNYAGGYGLTTINFPAPGINVRTTQDGNAYTTTTGTSFASPLTAGVIALLYAIPCPNFMSIVLADPQAGSDLIFNALMDGVDPKANMTNSFVAGGRLNAKNSMDLLMEETCSSCTPPLNPTISNITDNSATFSYDENVDVDTYFLFVRELGETDWIEFSSTGLSINATSLNACATYEYYMLVECPSETSAPSAILTFNTSGCGNCIDLTYCETGTTDPETTFTIHSPASIDGEITNLTLTNNWGGAIDDGYAYGNLVLVDDGTAASEEGCNALVNGAQINGNIAVAVRGTCDFSTKAFNAQNAGATALVIINNTGTGLATLGAGANAGSVTIPVIMISQADGAGLLAEISGGGSATGLLGDQNEWIESFELDGTLVTSGDDGGYRAPDLASIPMDIGATYNFTMTPGFDGQDLEEYTRIWIDLNQDGVFGMDEIVFDQGAGSFGAVSSNITIPGSATAGSTRLRVQMSYQGFGSTGLPDVCGTFASGEVEDYCIELIQTEFCNMNVVSTVTQPTCNEVQDGAISVVVSGGTPGYSYSWSNGAGDVDNVSTLNAGNYTLVITDGSGCDTTVQYNLNYTTVLTLNETITQPSCEDNADGEITVVASGSTGFTYQWTAGPANATYSGLNEGAFEVTATDVDGCMISEEYNLAYSTNLVLSATLTHPTCDDTNDGSITANASGGSGITYQWTAGPTDATYTGLANGDYTVTATAANGCTTEETYSLLANPGTVTAGFNSAMNFLMVTFTNTSTNGVSYSWDFGNGSTSMATNPIHTYGTPGTYTVCLTVTGDCDEVTTCNDLTVEANTASLDETMQNIEAHIYPNPATNEVSFVTSATDVASAEIITITGQLVISHDLMNNVATIDVSGLSEGIYIFNARLANGTVAFTQKLVIQK